MGGDTPEDGPASPFYQHGLVLACFLAVAISYLDRVNISVAILQMSKLFGWDHSLAGTIMSSFFVGYILTQVLGGSLAERLGGTIVLGVSVVLWSVFCAVTPLAAGLGIPALFAARVGLGVCEGVTFPAIYAMLGRWLPARRHGMAVGLVLSGIPAGNVLGLATTAPIVRALGWECVFYVAGVIGVAWAAAWFALMGGLARHAKHGGGGDRSRSGSWSSTRSSSGDSSDSDAVEGSDRWSTSEEARPADKEGRAAPRKLRVAELLQFSAVWAIVAAHFSSTWAGYVLMCWMPTYLQEGLGVDFSDVGGLALLPHITGFVCMAFVAGNMADWLISRGWQVVRVRKLMSTLGLGGMTLCLLVVPLVRDAHVAVAVMAAGSFASSLSVGGFFCNHLDLAPHQAGTILGITNTVATIPGIVGVYASGRILDAFNSWRAVFWVGAAIQSAGLAVFLSLGSTTPLVR